MTVYQFLPLLALFINAVLASLVLFGHARQRSHVVFGRRGPVGERPLGQIGIHSVRLGDAVSQHEIHFSGCDETITLSHSAHSRETFVAGALDAAAWIVGRSPALYSMRDVLRG